MDLRNYYHLANYGSEALISGGSPCHHCLGYILVVVYHTLILNPAKNIGCTYSFTAGTSCCKYIWFLQLCHMFLMLWWVPSGMYGNPITPISTTDITGRCRIRALCSSHTLPCKGASPNYFFQKTSFTPKQGFGKSSVLSCITSSWWSTRTLTP